MQLPKPDPQLLAAIRRLRSNPDAQAVVKHQQALLEHTQAALVVAPPDAFAQLQGRAQQLQAFLELMKKDTP